MDRALRREDLEFALGFHESGSLPTVSELIELIIEAEVQTLTEPDAISSELLQTAWYLHGVASASNASELYSPERQQRAFAVSAHIFDLALETRGHEIRDRLSFAFAAQVGYRRSDLDPNATAIWRRVDQYLDDAYLTNTVNSKDEVPRGSMRSGEHNDNNSESIPDDADAPHSDSDLAPGSAFSLMAVRAGVAFLGLEIRRISELLNKWHQEIAELRGILGVETLFTTMFGPGEGVVLAVTDLVEFLRFGQERLLESARSSLISVVNQSAGTGDPNSRWVAAHLLSVIDGLENSSVWSVLPPDTPPEVAQAFTIGNPPVLTLWPPQRDLLTRPSYNPLDSETKRLLLSVPTSTGKTLLSQIIMCHQLLTTPGSVCYVTPFRSLGREMKHALASRLSILHRSHVDDLSDFNSLEIGDLIELFSEDNESLIEILTPEQLANLLRRSPESIERFSMFVVDEAHLLADPQRGFLLESLLAVLKNSEARLVLLSAVIGNRQEVATWLDRSSELVLFSSDWSGPRRLRSILQSEIDWASARKIPTRSKKRPIRKDFEVRGRLDIKPPEGEIKSLYVDQGRPLGVKRLEYLPDNTAPQTSSRGSTPFYKVCAKAGQHFLKAGSLLMIVSRRDYARNAAKEIAGGLVASEKSIQLAAFLSERLGAEHPLIDCVRRGVGYHHAGLPTDVLDALEYSMRKGDLRALVATSTLTDGVNLPVRTVLIAETIYPGQPPSNQLNPQRLLNAIGRAGRAGTETEGLIVLAHQQPSEDSFDKLNPSQESLRVTSVLNSTEALGQLEETERLLNTNADAIFALAESATANFTSFVWFVLSAQQRLEDLLNSHDIVVAVQDLFAFQEMPQSLALRWQRLVEHVVAIFEATPVESRHRWAYAGTSLGSARRLEHLSVAITEHLLANTSDFIDDELETLPLEDCLNVFDATKTFDELFKLPEGRDIWKFRETPGGAKTLKVEILPALRSWLNGLDIPEIATSVLPMVSDISSRLEQMVDGINQAFEHYLSWTLGVLTTQVNEMLSEREAPLRLQEDISDMVRYGVNTSSALALIYRGVRSRRLAHVIGQRASAEEFTMQATIEHLRNLHINGWVETFQATPREIEDLLEIVRSFSKDGLLAGLLSEGQAAANVYRTEASAQVREQPVSIRISEPHAPIEVWTNANIPQYLGLIEASEHQDLVALTSAGLFYTATSDGHRLTVKTVSGHRESYD